MELFNKYKNKNFAFMTNYINSCINDDSLSLTEDELRKQLSGASQSSFEEFLSSLTNACDADELYNANLLYCSDGVMQPLRQIPVPIRASIAEKAWLYYVLQNSKADLFLENETKEKLINALESDIDSARFPIRSEYIDMRMFSPDIHLDLSDHFLKCFKTIVTAIKNKKSLYITNNSFAGKVYENQHIYPYKLEYSPQFDSFSLSCCPVDIKRPIKMNLGNITNVALGEKIDDHDAFLKQFEKELSEIKEKTPITIEIKNQADAYDRCAYLFSSFDTYCYDKGDDTLIMNIYYYRFQKEEIIRNILFLGHYVKILSPKDITDEVVVSIKNAYEQYL